MSSLSSAGGSDSAVPEDSQSVVFLLLCGGRPGAEKHLVARAKQAAWTMT
jgi:hypothetical protein